MVGVGEMLVGAAVKEAVAQASKLLALALAPAGGQLSMMWTFQEDVRKMKDTLESMQAVLMDAEKLSVRDEVAKLWLKRLKKAAYDIAHMFEDLDADADADKPRNKLLPSINNDLKLPWMLHRAQVQQSNPGSAALLNHVQIQAVPIGYTSPSPRRASSALLPVRRSRGRPVARKPRSASRARRQRGGGGPGLLGGGGTNNGEEEGHQERARSFAGAAAKRQRRSWAGEARTAAKRRATGSGRASTTSQPSGI